jgi:opacity protein-like surface antigen
MRNGFIITLAAGLILISTAAAEFNPQLLYKGVKGGINIASAAGHRLETKSHTGYSLGGFFGYRQYKTLGLQMELLLASKGYEIPKTISYDSSGNPAGTAKVTVMIDYLEVPILAKFSLPLNGKAIPYLVAGPYAALSMREKLRVQDTAATLVTDLGNSEKNDVGLIFGAGVDLKAGNGKIFFETRYEIGFLPVIKNEHHKNRVWSFQTGYSW